MMIRNHHFFMLKLSYANGFKYILLMNKDT